MDERKRRRFWDPWEGLWEEMFEFPRFGLGVRPFLFRRLFGETETPLIDIEDKGDELVVVADMPGVRKEDIDIEVEPTYIRISSETKYKKEEEKKDYYYKERRYTGFSRGFSLPEEVVPEKAKAEYVNGVLRVYLPKAKPKPKRKGKKVKVK